MASKPTPTLNLKMIREILLQEVHRTQGKNTEQPLTVVLDAMDVLDETVDSISYMDFKYDPKTVPGTQVRIERWETGFWRVDVRTTDPDGGRLEFVGTAQDWLVRTWKNAKDARVYHGSVQTLRRGPGPSV